MNQITFKKVKFKNFLSYGNTFTLVRLDNHKTTLIYGKNGSGKSGFLLDTLCYSLYGVAFRHINKPQLLNSINKKNLLVEIDFSIGKNEYKVRRGMSPSIFEIYINGELKPQESTVKDYQNFLENNILGVNYKTFTQIVVLGSADYTQFMKLEAADRREIVENILDIKIFTAMDGILKQKVSDHKKEVSENNHEISLLKEKINTNIQLLKQAKTNTEDLVNEKNEKIKKYTQESLELSELIANRLEQVSVLSKIEGESSIRSKLKALEEYSKEISKEKIDIGKQLSFYEKNDNCPTCRQPIGLNFKENIKAEKESRSKKIENILKKVSLQEKELLEQIKEFDKRASEISKIHEEILVNEKSNSILQKLISELQIEISKANEKSEDLQKLKSDLLELDSFFKERKMESEKLSENKQIIDIASSILKDGGIKSRIIKQYIPIINKFINKHLSSLDFFVNFEFNEEFKETIKSRYRDIFSYDSFSNGEKVRIDLSLLLTWRSITKMRNNMSSNLLVLDEIFDNSLDTSGTEEFLNLLKHIDEDINVFVISPKGDAIIDKFDNAIRVEKKKNFSKLVYKV